MNRYKMVLFDMDGTLLKNRTIFVFAERKGFMDRLINIINSNIVSYKKSIEIAKLLKGASEKELLEIFRSIPLNKDVEKVVDTLKKKRIITAIVTNSYQFVADDLRKRLGINHAFANNLIIENGIVNGELEINNKQLVKEHKDCNIHSICKVCILDDLCSKFEIDKTEVIAVGDGEIDICMLKKAGLGIAFNASDKVQKHADINTYNMEVILKYI